MDAGEREGRVGPSQVKEAGGLLQGGEPTEASTVGTDGARPNLNEGKKKKKDSTLFTES